jgi:tRNA (mo5U34)-methyltransferase
MVVPVCWSYSVFVMPIDGLNVFNYESLFRQLEAEGHCDWVESLRTACRNAIQSDRHGLLPTWLDLLQQIPVPDESSWQIKDGHVVVPARGSGVFFGQTTSDTTNEPEPKKTPDPLPHILQQFRPWRKGPFNLGGTVINTEWRSDLKWDRIANHVEWRDRRVLDVGCGNGYFGWRMLDAGAQSVVGLDPFLLFVVQHEIVRRLAGDAPNYVLPLTDACLLPQLNAFDIALSMGVLYHRTSPIDHLQMLRESLKPGGQLVLETLVVESEEPTVLVPEDRYAKMRNVWFIPSPSMLTLWLQRTGFRDIKVIDITPTTSTEQRGTDWMTFESLSDFLDPNDSTRTAEGYPAPVRAVLTAHPK